MPLVDHHYNNHRDGGNVYLEPEDDHRLDETIEEFLGSQSEWGRIYEEEDDNHDEYDEMNP